MLWTLGMDWYADVGALLDAGTLRDGALTQMPARVEKAAQAFPTDTPLAAGPRPMVWADLVAFGGRPLPPGGVASPHAPDLWRAYFAEKRRALTQFLRPAERGEGVVCSL